jgi:hypothetical protein
MRIAIAVTALLCAAMPARAQQPAMKWTFNFDATWGTFGFGNSLFQDPRENTPVDLSDQWFEGTMKGALGGVFSLASSGQVYGSLSAVGERTYGAAPRLVGPDISSFGAEDLSIGWRSGRSLGSHENLVDISVGRLPYRIGHGMLIADGSAEGGSRGAYWSNARRAFELGVIARLSPGSSRVEAFYLDRDDLPEHDIGTRLTGVNYEFTVGDHSTFGAAWFRTFANSEDLLRRDGMNVFNARAYTAPPALRGLGVEAEYAAERNGDLVAANAWTAEPSLSLETAWHPSVSYRYAMFQGDNPQTPQDEAFDPLMPGFHDWGTWFQGEIVGGYAASNSNLVSHRARLHIEPRDTISGGLMLYKFRVDQPGSFEGGVTSRDLAGEADLYLDWQVRERLTASVVVAFADPQAAAEQAYGRTRSFRYGLVFLAYKY